MELFSITPPSHIEASVPIVISLQRGDMILHGVTRDNVETGQPASAEIQSVNPEGDTITLTITTITTLTLTTQESVAVRKFRKLADQWRRETRYQSSVTKMAMHPAYQQIIGMGQEALTLILKELQKTRGHWLWALVAIVGEDHAPEGCNFSEAVDAWLDWGMRHHYI